jgi:hypothetical protein
VAELAIGQEGPKLREELPFAYKLKLTWVACGSGLTEFNTSEPDVIIIKRTTVRVPFDADEDDPIYVFIYFVCALITGAYTLTSNQAQPRRK